MDICKLSRERMRSISREDYNKSLTQSSAKNLIISRSSPKFQGSENDLLLEVQRYTGALGAVAEFVHQHFNCTTEEESINYCLGSDEICKGKVHRHTHSCLRGAGKLTALACRMDPKNDGRTGYN